jgi:hypothetical protein
MAKTLTFIAANLEPELYEKLKQKYPAESDTSLIIKGLNLLLEHSDKTINLDMMKPEVWDAVIKKAKEKNVEIENIAGELLFRWLQGEFKVGNETT